MTILEQCQGSWFSIHVPECCQWMDALSLGLVDQGSQEYRGCGTFLSLGCADL